MILLRNTAVPSHPCSKFSMKFWNMAGLLATPKGKRKNPKWPSCMFITKAFRTISVQWSCAYAFLRSILLNFCPPFSFAQSSSGCGKGYLWTSKPVLHQTSPKVDTLAFSLQVLFTVTMGAAQSEWSIGIIIFSWTSRWRSFFTSFLSTRGAACALQKIEHTFSFRYKWTVKFCSNLVLYKKH